MEALERWVLNLEVKCNFGSSLLRGCTVSIVATIRE